VPRWRILDDVAATAWTDAIDMTDAQVASPATARTGGRPTGARSRTSSGRQAGSNAAYLPSSDPQVNTAATWAALRAASIAGWLHQLTAAVEPGGQLFGHGVRGGQA
jgi:hypothetical protein